MKFKEDEINPSPFSVTNTAGLVTNISIRSQNKEKINQTEISEARNRVEQLKKEGKGKELAQEVIKQTKNAGIGVTYAMQALILSGFTLDEIRKYGEPVAKNADFSLKNIMETKSSAQMMVEQQILGMVAVKKFEEDTREKEKYKEFGKRKEEDT